MRRCCPYRVAFGLSVPSVRALCPLPHQIFPLRIIFFPLGFHIADRSGLYALSSIKQQKRCIHRNLRHIQKRNDAFLTLSNQVKRALPILVSQPKKEGSFTG